MEQQDEMVRRYNERYQKLSALRVELMRPYIIEKKHEDFDYSGRFLYRQSVTLEDDSHIIRYIPEPSLPSERWKYLANVLAPVILEHIKTDFEIHGKHEHRIDDVKSLITEIESFRSTADSLTAAERTKILNTSGPPWPRDKSALYEYYRIKNGEYYKIKQCELAWGNTTAFVYAKYFLYYDFLKGLVKNDVPPSPSPMLQELKKKLQSYGFSDLPSIKALPEGGMSMIMNHLAENDVPYQVAMLDTVGFIKHLKNKYCPSNTELYKCVADILSTGGRTIKGNCLVLDSKSKEDKNRYTAHEYKETTKEDYQKVKLGVRPG